MSASIPIPRYMSVYVNPGFSTAVPWQFIFNPAHTTHTLTHLSTTDELGSQLLKLLLEHTPALQYLQVSSVAVGREYSDRQWALKQLRVTHERAVTCRQLASLPRSTAGRVALLGVPNMGLRSVFGAVSD